MDRSRRFRIEHYFGEGKGERVVYHGTVTATSAEQALRSCIQDLSMWMIDASRFGYATALDLRTAAGRYNALVAEPE